MGLPAGELIEDIQAEFIACVEEVAVRRIVARAHGVAIHLLDQVDVV
jgi:hypothetical protein